ncbi:uncharacterized protein CTHT_0047470 [Thermochaetoides thermophila DSM 1495]|uniref:Amino acid transporter transmembrane domain-containing protein n=1 Tax=Chaetomium thermophilum (strain DSM 1495 / CBS 144.50 / IMI 039719) TaxID=759272 RepID=G0S9X0_CHATD|nr:hypothetical protein CTHT_0047470 [Thermochaetoides thermophila DSM 1495]EGS20231.1 hypothetical protein CTHT_0047470 [Thermochaetoides thermophila DSM 1495]
MSYHSSISHDQRGTDARIVSEHLPPGYTAEFHPLKNSCRDNGSISSTSGAELPSSFQESSLCLQGGDIHRDLFKIHSAASPSQGRRRTNSFPPPRVYEQPQVSSHREIIPRPGFTVGDQLVPGGFRRAFLRLYHGPDSRVPLTRDFVEFLDLYGHFAGEDLLDSEAEATVRAEEEEDEGLPPERQPLLRERVISRLPAPKSANAGTVKTFFTLIKAFVGTGIMFLPKAFSNGGLLFSCLVMLALAVITMIAFHLLLQCKHHYSGGYGEIGQAIAGYRMRSIILFSIALSQLGFVCAGIVFVAENLSAFLDAVTPSIPTPPLSTTALIILQLLILTPLSWIRNISKLGPAALLADVCILIGISYIYTYTIKTISHDGSHHGVTLFNPSAYTLTIGSAIFTFEGIGLILPIEASMAKPSHFESLLALVMGIITVVFTSIGALCYIAFGDATQIEIINNLPQDNRLVNVVQLLYAIAVLVGTPVQLFPAQRILESVIFGAHRSGKRSLKTKWTKNMFRFCVVVLCGIVAVIGTGNLDRNSANYEQSLIDQVNIPLVGQIAPKVTRIAIACTVFRTTRVSAPGPWLGQKYSTPA